MNTSLRSSRPETALRRLREIPHELARLLRERQLALDAARQRYRPDVYAGEHINQKLAEVQEDYEAKIRALHDEAMEQAKAIRQAAAAQRQAQQRDPGREAAKARAWSRYLAALTSGASPYDLVTVAERDADPLLALETLAEELPAYFMLRGEEAAARQADKLVRQRMLPLLPPEQRALLEAEAALERGLPQLEAAFAYVAEYTSGAWESLPGLPDFDGESLVALEEPGG
jgi:hypothetical protein